MHVAMSRAICIKISISKGALTYDQRPPRTMLVESPVGDHAGVPFALWKKTRRCLGPTHAGSCPVACHDATLAEKSIKSSSRRRFRTRGDDGRLLVPDG